MKRRRNILQIKVRVTETTWRSLADIGSAPREIFIALSRISPDQVRALSHADVQKLFKRISPAEIAQIAIRTYLQQSAPLSAPEKSSDPATLNHVARAVLHDYPDAYRNALQNDAGTIRKSKPFEKRTKQLVIKLTPIENENFRWLANRMNLGPSDLGGLLIERFAHEFPAYMQAQLQPSREKKDHHA